MKLNKQEGFTLLELLVALGILSIIVITFTTILAIGIRGNTKNDKDIKALQLAQSEIEIIRNQIKNGDTIFKNSSGNNIVSGESYEKKIYESYFTVTIHIDKDINSPLYTIRAIVKPIGANNKQDYFSKKETEVITQVYGK